MLRILAEASNSGGSDVRITILVYETPNLTVVLDGNHRLAALLRAESIRADDRPLIVFRLGEIPALRKSDIIEPDEHKPAENTDKCWFGFNPDVDLAKGERGRPTSRCKECEGRSLFPSLSTAGLVED